jgi:hypothetical protein
MQRLKEYCRIVAWQTGLGYLLLWAVTFWTLDEGPAVFAHSGVCHPDLTAALFYWTCDPASPMQILASLANGALTATVWAPIYVAAATVVPAAIVVAGWIMAVHVIGLPLGLFVLIRGMTKAFDALRLVRSRIALADPAAPPPASDRTVASAGPLARVGPPRRPLARRPDFGLRLLLRR